jgi:putative protease
VWRTHNPSIEKSLNGLRRRQGLRVRASAREGLPLVLEWILDAHPEVSIEVRSENPLGAAASRPLTLEFLTEQLGRLGDSQYELKGVDLDIQGSPFAPASLLNQMRRRAVALLPERQESRGLRTAANPDAALARLITPARPAFAEGPYLHLLVRTPGQLEAAISLSPSSITLDYLDLYGLRPSLERVKAGGIEVRVASPRVLKPGEERIVDFLLRCDCSILVRSSGLLDALGSRTRHELIGDFSS